MAESGDRSICGLPDWLPMPSNDTASFIQDVVLCAINVPFCVFAFLGNLAVILAVIKTPSLQRPCNILLCSLAATDCFTGLIAQPLFVAWRLKMQRIHESCDYQAELFHACYVSQAISAAWTFANITLISFDRHFALAKPLVYRTSVTKKDAVVAAIITWTTWLIVAILISAVLPPLPALVLGQVLGLMLFILPIVNHIGIFIAIRRHNIQVAGAIPQENASVLFKREKKVAIDMIIIIIVLLLCMAPLLAFNTFLGGVYIPDKFAMLKWWCLTLIYLNSSINPVVYLVRKSEIRSAVKSLVGF